MPANVDPIFPLTPKIGIGNLSSAITTRTVSGVTGLVSVFAAGSNGSIIDTIQITATATTTAGMVRLWLYAGSGNAQLYDEVIVSAITPSSTTPAFSSTIYYNGTSKTRLVLPTGYTLYACPHNAEAFNVIAYGGDY